MGVIIMNAKRWTGAAEVLGQTYVILKKRFFLMKELSSFRNSRVRLLFFLIGKEQQNLNT